MNHSSGELNNLANRARELKQLGNSDAEIRAVLLRSGAQPDEVETVLAEIRPAGKKSGGNCLLFVAIGMVIAVIAGGVLAALFVFAPAAEKQTGAAESLLQNPIINDFEIPTAEVFVKPPTAVVSLSPEAEAYFSVIWNLQGTPAEKATQLQAAQPPPDLTDEHAVVSIAYKKFAGFDAEEQDLKNKIKVDCDNKAITDYCRNLNLELMSVSMNRDKSQSDMLQEWLKTCEVWRDYYELDGVPFPYGQSRCKYP